MILHFSRKYVNYQPKFSIKVTNRSAVDAIKGYLYQFNLTILEILKLKAGDDFITVEGVEDIDLDSVDESIAIQCKYHSQTEYNHSVIAKPIRLMLNHFRDVLDGNQKRINYLYFAHFKNGHEKFLTPITLDFLKSNLLTYTKEKIEYKHYEDLCIDDIQLIDFLTLLEIDINAKDYEEMLNDIYKAIKSQISNCDDFEAKHFYYNNALKVISTLARQEDILNRKISKKEFISQINSKQFFFHKWFIQIKGKKIFFKDLRSKYFTQYNISPFERFFLIEIDPNNYVRNELKDIVLFISKKWSDVKSKKNPDTFCPYLFIRGIAEDELIEIKKELSNENFKFVDGFNFSGSSFNPRSIIEKATYHNQYKIKIINDINYIDMVINELANKTKEIYQFYLDAPYFDCNNDSVKHIKIQIEEINDLKNIL
ncbi:MULTISPECIES: DUF4297 family anti-phage-associated protein [Chryseobacterium]|uniref:DUF4297 family anti-phage-associated protein n=1 Tax=Chryseobacterium sp. R2A-55 TaxID=2744445 RepID=UPI001F2E66B2|nr:DUF4297 family anti-phage-associated protein [Chryseobacterium sp. R2A-55]